MAPEAPSDADPTAALSPELFAQIKGIELRAQRLVTDILAGEYSSAFKGRGMEFEKVREYQPGDDVRHIDWNVTARMRAPFVKEFREERELTVMLMVDVSSSGAFGSVGRWKNEVAAEVAAVMAYTAIRSNDRVGLIIFSDRIEHTIPPKKGRAHVWRVIRDILTFRPSHRGTRIAMALEYLGQLVRRRAVTFVISDFIDDNFSDALQIASKKHDITAISVTDPREEEMPAIGILELEDAESGEWLLVDTAAAGHGTLFTQASRDFARRRSAIFAKAGVSEIQLRTDAPTIDPIVRFFHQRERKRRT